MATGALLPDPFPQLDSVWLKSYVFLLVKLPLPNSRPNCHRHLSLSWLLLHLVPHRQYLPDHPHDSLPSLINLSTLTFVWRVKYTISKILHHLAPINHCPVIIV